MSEDNEIEEEEEEEEPEEPEEAYEEEQQQEKTVTDVVYEAFLGFNVDKTRLDKDLKNLRLEIDALREMIYVPQQLDDYSKPPWLENSHKFKILLDYLSKGIGLSLEYVRMIEKSRKTPSLTDAAQIPEDEEEKPIHQNTQNSTPVIVNAGQKEQPKMGFLAAREFRILEEKRMAYLESQKTIEPAAVTEEKVNEISEYGKQLLPAINKVKNWLPGALAECALFPDTPSVHWVLHEELSSHLGKYFGTLEAFCTAYTQYLKTVIDGRRISMAKALARIAETQSGGMIAPVQKGGTFMAHGAQLGPGGFDQKK